MEDCPGYHHLPNNFVCWNLISPLYRHATSPELLCGNHISHHKSANVPHLNGHCVFQTSTVIENRADSCPVNHFSRLCPAAVQHYHLFTVLNRHFITITQKPWPQRGENWPLRSGEALWSDVYLSLCYLNTSHYSLWVSLRLPHQRINSPHSD